MTTDEQIRKLYELGRSYTQIASLLGINRTAVYRSLHKERAKAKNVLSRKKQKDKVKNSPPHILASKVDAFLRRRKKVSISASAVWRDVYNSLAANPICYLTGRSVNISDGASYHLDHILPLSKGGESLVSNMGITCAQANRSKGKLTNEEFIDLCYDVAKYAGRI